MKHDFKIVVLLVTFYLLAQIIGLGIVYNDIKVERAVTQAGQIIIIISHPETALGPRPDVYNFDAIVLVLISVLIGTGLILLVVRFNSINIWKGFFFFAVFFSITIAVGVFFNWYVAAVIGFILAIVKMWKHNILIHNVTEVLIYSGIAVLFAPLFEPLWVIVLLLIISVYDAFAVWKSKHMIKMAEFQIESEAFAGLSIPYKSKSSLSFKKKGYSTQRNSLQNKKQKTKTTQAILGGGDIAFPLIFAASVMESLIKTGLIGPAIFFKALFIPIITAIVLLLLMVFGKRGRYYPAMPFLTAACLAGYGLVLLL